MTLTKAYTPKASEPMVNGFDPSRIEELPPRARQQVGDRERLLGPGYRLFYDDPVEIVRGAGTLLYDADGNDYLDVYNNVTSVGHCHPYVVEAVHRQLSTLNTNTRYIQQSILSYSEQFLGTMPAELGHVMFTCTGSEANDLAMRVARYYTGNQGVIVTSGAYHGLTADVSAFSPSLGVGVPLGPHVRTISPPDRLRHGGDVVEAMRREIRAAIATWNATASGSRRSSPTRSSPLTASTPTPWGSSSRSSKRSTTQAACSSPTRCSQVSGVPANTGGAFSVTAWFPTS